MDTFGNDSALSLSCNVWFKKAEQLFASVAMAKASGVSVDGERGTRSRLDRERWTDCLRVVWGDKEAARFEVCSAGADLVGAQ
jgi:hypothetical protein